MATKTFIQQRIKTNWRIYDNTAMTKKKTISISIDAERLKKLDELAQYEKTSRSAVVREAVNKEYNRTIAELKERLRK